jgi:hypothetical protein
MAHRYRSVLLAFALVGCGSRAPAKAVARQPNADSASAVSAERDAAGEPPAEAPDTKQLKRAIHDLSVAIFNARVNHKDTADAPAWTAKLDAVANEMPAASDADPSYAAAYQRTQDAIQLARWRRLSEAYADADTAYKQLH